MKRLALRSTGLVALFVLGVAGASCAEGATGEVDLQPGNETGGDEDTGSGGDDTSIPDTGAGDDTGGGGDTGGTSEAGDTSMMTDGAGDGAGDGGKCSMGCPVNFWDIDGDPLTGECGCEYACTKKGTADPIDPDFTDDNCDGGDGVVEKCVYVSGTTGDDTKSGTRKEPMKTIAAAIAQAKTLGVDVCLAGESFSGLVTMESGVSVYGGFDEKDPNFKFRRSKTATTTLVSEGTVVYAPKIDVDTHLEGLTMSASAPATGVGVSIYGVRLGGGSGTFYVRYNKITVASALPGGDGMLGTKGDDGPDGVRGEDGKSNDSGGRGGGVALASPCGASGGTGGPGGYGNGDGTVGNPGSGGVSGGTAGSKAGSCTSSAGGGGVGGSSLITGGSGSPGGTSVALGKLSSDAFYQPATAPSGGDGIAGSSGAGGGGGGGRRSDGSVFCLSLFGTHNLGGGGGGSGGNGGCGGKGGGGGQGGGGSFGITAAGGSLVVDLCDITVGKGGLGGNGKGGGTGGKGGAGGPGGAGVKGGSPAGGNAGDGGSGGPGANGGPGGPGSGGAGGPSTCVASSSSATVTFSTGLGKNSCTNGGGGGGGLGGSSGGVTGAAGPPGASGASLTF